MGYNLEHPSDLQNQQLFIIAEFQLDYLIALTWPSGANVSVVSMMCICCDHNSTE
jgi:hypothetical protein